jgi:hypothetical protein
VIHSRKIDTMDTKLLTEFGKREAMSHQENRTNKTDTTHTRARYKYSEDLARELDVNVTKQTGVDVVAGMLNHIIKKESTDQQKED